MILLRMRLLLWMIYSMTSFGYCLAEQELSKGVHREKIRPKRQNIYSFHFHKIPEKSKDGEDFLENLYALPTNSKLETEDSQLYLMQPVYLMSNGAMRPISQDVAKETHALVRGPKLDRNVIHKHGNDFLVYQMVPVRGELGNSRLAQQSLMSTQYHPYPSATKEENHQFMQNTGYQNNMNSNTHMFGENTNLGYQQHQNFNNYQQSSGFTGQMKTSGYQNVHTANGNPQMSGYGNNAGYKHHQNFEVDKTSKHTPTDQRLNINAQLYFNPQSQVNEGHRNYQEHGSKQKNQVPTYSEQSSPEVNINSEFHFDQDGKTVKEFSSPYNHQIAENDKNTKPKIISQKHNLPLRFNLNVQKVGPQDKIRGHSKKNHFVNEKRQGPLNLNLKFHINNQSKGKESAKKKEKTMIKHRPRFMHKRGPRRRPRPKRIHGLRRIRPSRPRRY